MHRIKLTNLTPKLSEIVQKFLINNYGYKWRSSGAKVLYLREPVIGIDKRNFWLTRWPSGGDYEAMNAQTQFGEFVRWVSGRLIIFKLNEKYTAEIGKDSTVVGCQTFDNKIILELAEKIKELR